MVKKCVQCGKEFELTGAEIDYYKEHDMVLPKRCRACRQANRIKKNDAVVPRGRIRRQRRKSAIKSVPITVLIMLIVATFWYLNFVRSTPESNHQNNSITSEAPANVQSAVMFRSDELLKEHYEKHGISMGYQSAEEYLAGANATINNSTALHKLEKEDGDDVYYVKATNDFVVVSTDGYIRTYFRPDDGIRYFQRQ